MTSDTVHKSSEIVAEDLNKLFDAGDEAKVELELQFLTQFVCADSNPVSFLSMASEVIQSLPGKLLILQIPRS